MEMFAATDPRCPLQGRLQVLQDKRKNTLHRVLAKDTVYVPIAGNHLPLVGAASIRFGELIQGNVSALRQEAFVLRAMNKCDGDGQPVQVGQVYVVALKVDQVAADVQCRFAQAAISTESSAALSGRAGQTRAERLRARAGKSSRGVKRRKAVCRRRSGGRIG